MSGATVAVSWQAIGVVCTIVVLWSGLFLWSIKWLLDRFAAHEDQRFTSLEKLLADWTRRTLELERDFARLLAEMPKEYVRREDWIRFGTTMTAKIDGIWARLDEMRNCRNTETPNG